MSQGGDELRAAEKANQQCCDPGHNSKATYDSDRGLPMKSADDKTWHPQEAEHRAKERKHWRVQNTIAVCGITLTLVAAGGGVASAIYANRALEASQEGVQAAWKAVQAAQRQATAAESQLEMQKQAADASQVPNLSSQMEYPNNLLLKPGSPLSLAVSVLNAGPGTAYGLKVSAKISVLEISKVTENSFSDSLPEDPGAGYVLVPTTQQKYTHYQSLGRPLTTEDLAAAPARDDSLVGIFFYGQITYRDFLGQKYVRILWKT